MSSRRDYRSSRNALFDGIEEGGIRASPYSSSEIDEQDNDEAIDGLHDRVNILKRLTGDIHEEVETHNLMLDRMVPYRDNCKSNPFLNWAMIWMLPEESYLEPWTDSRRFLKRNQAAGWSLLLLPFWRSFCLYIT
ncbi:Bet1-like SNARE 1-1 [Apostasia shenzhenica]|uniref:Bet1-like SNARE 1-1 n=1 Tax=Apostasia shenzhenica TaxID=1088818 RepID=A0A2I0A480_9ASPA|nr:Bet1-like SNARE 1-1 [Apostasia shenzhenica]